MHAFQLMLKSREAKVPMSSQAEPKRPQPNVSLTYSYIIPIWRGGGGGGGGGHVKITMVPLCSSLGALNIGVSERVANKRP